MTDEHRKLRAPHGVTGDTVQQAAEVSKPTSDVGRALDDPRVPQDPPHPDPLVVDTRPGTKAGARR